MDRNAVDAFEAKYVEPLRVWSRALEADELEELLRVTAGMREDMESLGRELRMVAPALHKGRWSELTAELRVLLPEVESRARAIAKDSRERLSTLGHGSKGLAGYRLGQGGDSRFLDHES